MAQQVRVQKKVTKLDAARLHTLTAQKAYQRYEQRGCCHGHDLDDWLEAERLVRQERGFPQAHPTGSA